MLGLIFRSVVRSFLTFLTTEHMIREYTTVPSRLFAVSDTCQLSMCLRLWLLYCLKLIMYWQSKHRCISLLILYGHSPSTAGLKSSTKRFHSPPFLATPIHLTPHMYFSIFYTHIPFNLVTFSQIPFKLFFFLFTFIESSNYVICLICFSLSNAL